jgi:hypothetical protein
VLAEVALEGENADGGHIPILCQAGTFG